MFGWFRPRPKQSSALIDLRLDRSTTSQEQALAAFRDWANELVSLHRFRMTAEQGDGINYIITLIREEDEPEWLRSRVEARLHVEEDHRDRRVLGTYCELLVDSRYTQEERGPEISLLKPFTPADIAKARKAMSAFLVKVKS